MASSIATSAFAGASLLALVTLAGSCALLAGVGDYTATAGDAAIDAPVDATGDSSSGDSGAGFCATRVPEPRFASPDAGHFCEDFDADGGYRNAWNVQRKDGVVDFDEKAGDSVSPPRSLAVGIPPHDAGSSLAPPWLEQSFGPAQSVRCSFDFSVKAIGQPGVVPSVAAVSFSVVSQTYATYAFYWGISGAAGGDAVGIDLVPNGGDAGITTGSTPLPHKTSGWENFAVELTSSGALDAGPAFDVFIDRTFVAELPVPQIPPASAIDLKIGMYNSTSPDGVWEFLFDDVACDYE